jgi:hypothetical protein
MGLVFAAICYNDMIIISFTACSEELPDPAVLALCLRDSFQEYMSRVHPAARRKPATRMTAAG